jgi:selenocysteine lyase/cysteine desulfurase
VLTTDSEFHSFSRQMARLREEGLVALDVVPAVPFESFAARFAAAAASARHDLVFFSHVFFNSGFVVPDLAGLVAAVPSPEALIVIDGYHAFMALPVDLACVQHRAFYLGGGYKYACAGEGTCFLVCPPGLAMRPRNTGWYASFGSLAEEAGERVAYTEDGGRFMGATFDPSGLYRLNAAMRWMAEVGIDAQAVHARAQAMQDGFVAAMNDAGIAGLRRSDLIVPHDAPDRGNFLAYRSPGAARQQAALDGAGIVTDVRGDVLRIGFGLYHDPADLPAITGRFRECLS